MSAPDLLPPGLRLLVVTGKGGVGKSSVAAALATLAARRGARVLLCEVGARPRAGALLREGLEVGYDPIEAAPGVWLCHVTPAAALREYVLARLKLASLTQTLLETPPVRALLRLVPSLGETVVLGKVWFEAEARRDEGGRPRWDLVVLDAPASGHGVPFLRVPWSLLETIPAGPIREEAGAMAATLGDPVRTRLLLVTWPEELPVHECLELAARLEAELPVARLGVLLNGWVAPPFTPEEVTRLEAAAGEDREGASPPLSLETVAARAGLRAARRAARAVAARERLAREAGLPVAVAPRLRTAGWGALEVGALASALATAHLEPAGQPARAAAPVLPAEAATRAAPRPPAARPRVLVVIGPGGVGKTTLAAALALRAARVGQRVTVLTVDPARRLADCLGLAAGRQEASWSAAALQAAGVAASGSLRASTLDVARTCDEVFRRYAPSPEDAERILREPFYRATTTALPGAQEYMAMERLHQLWEEEPSDLLVLDTPPAAHAIEFLDAPERMLRAFGNRALRQLLSNPAFAKGQLARLATQLGSSALQQLAALTGLEALQALGAFLQLMQGMFNGFSERAAQVQALLGGDQTRFVLVTAPDASRLDETRHLRGALAERGLTLRGVLVNRVRPDWRRAAGGELAPAGLAAAWGPELGPRLAEALAGQQAEADQDAAALEALQRGLPGLPFQVVPDWSEDLPPLVRLDRLGDALEATPGLRPEPGDASGSSAG